MWDTLHLDPVAPPVAKTWVGESLLQASMAGQQEQTFTVCIQTTRCVDLGHIDELGQTPPAAVRLGSELTQHPIGLVQQQGGQVNRRFRGLSTD